MKTWALCECGGTPGDHQAVILRPIAIDHGTRVLFEGTLGACLDNGCGCDMYARDARVVS